MYDSHVWFLCMTLMYDSNEGRSKQKQLVEQQMPTLQ